MTLEQAFIRARFVSLEAAVGPFYQPERLHPMADLATARQRASELETMLERLLEVRRRSWRLALLLALVYAAVPAAIIRLELGLAGLAGACTFGLVAALSDRALFWWFWPHGSKTLSLFLLSGLPEPESLNQASLGLHDAILGLSESDRSAFVDELRADSPPLVAAAARASWTLLPSQLRDDLLRR